MQVTSSPSRQKSWQTGRARVSVLAEMALRREKVVQKLLELRERNTLTQEQAAHKVGVTYRQWQRWEAGESMPYPRNLDLIASKFGITVADFFDEEVEPPAPLPLPTGLQAELAKVHSELASLNAKVEQVLATVKRNQDFARQFQDALDGGDELVKAAWEAAALDPDQKKERRGSRRSA